MSDKRLSLIASVVIAVACGTNYAYSTWAPQFGQRLRLSSTDVNLIGSFGNLGMYMPAIPVGMIVDRRPRIGVAAGVVFLGFGYLGLYAAFVSGTGNVAILCFFSFLTGCGSCTAFLGALKTAAINYPHRHGTATGLPLAGFGLSAFIFSSIFNVYPDTAAFLLMLAISTSFLNGVCFFLVGSFPDESPEAVGLLEETPKPADIRGMALLRTRHFWQFFVLFGLLSGIGLMNINNIGNDVQALWRRYDPSMSAAFVARQQAMHVSVLSLSSCAGRLLSGTGSDYLSRRRTNRLWCMVASAAFFSVAQLFLSVIESPYHLVLVSVFTGLAYGTLYGFTPSLLVERFGIAGMSQNWGTFIFAPVVSGNVFALLAGKIYDARSVVLPDGSRVCLEGLLCYRTASIITLCVALLAAFASLVSVRIDKHRT